MARNIVLIQNFSSRNNSKKIMPQINLMIYSFIIAFLCFLKEHICVALSFKRINLGILKWLCRRFM